MVYERRLGWRKLPTEVFVCAKKSLKRGVSTPHPLHPTYTTLSRYTFPHPVAVVRPEGSQTPLNQTKQHTLVVTYPWSQKRKHGLEQHEPNAPNVAIQIGLFKFSEEEEEEIC